jgi:hypothetical protein
MKKTLLYTVLITGLLAGTACEDFLEKEPSNAVSTSIALASVEDCNTAINGVYAYIRAAYLPQAIYYFDVTTDNLVPMKNFANNYYDLLRYNWNSSSAEAQSVWDNRYSTIVNANNIINVIDDLPGDDNDRARIKSEALVARALAHHDLVRLFAKRYNSATAATDLGVPYVKESTIEDKARNTVAEVYGWIVQDIEDAIPGLKDTDINYFSKSAAYILLSRVKLYMQDYPGVIAAAADFENVSNGAFGLADTEKEFKEVWSLDKGKEIVFQISLATNEYSQGRAVGDYFINDSQGLPHPDVVPSKNGSTGIVDQYSAGDYRLSAYFRDTVTKQYNTQTLVFKYAGNKTSFPTATFRTNTVKIFRYAELLLNKAEAQVRATSAAPALITLNELLTHRGVAPASSVNEDLIFAERRKEFPVEGHYFHDIKRFGKGFTRISQTDSHPTTNPISVEATNYHFVWPIPILEIRANRLMEQNEGYVIQE